MNIRSRESEIYYGFAEYLGYIVIAALVTACVFAVWTGFMLGIAPYSPGGGSETLLFGYTRGAWEAVHSWLSAAAVAAVPVAIIVGRKSFRKI
jgi:hypothetical protein